MEKLAAHLVNRDLEIFRIDLAILRSEAKSLWLLARAQGNDHDVKVTGRILDTIDKVVRETDDPALFHPTLF